MKNLNNTPSPLDYDQVSELVVKNRSFLRDFLLLVCGLVIFIMLVVVCLVVFQINKTSEQQQQRAQQFERDVATSYDYRLRNRNDNLNLS